jgi:uncharacterized protein DUF4105
VKKILCCSFFIFFSFQLFSQTDSCKIRISLLTCTPGLELYSTFGHSALRVYDSSSGSDLIYNYGTFDFYDPAFYSKFTRGKLLYFLSVEKLEDFMAGYEYEKRGITEQALNLSCDEKLKLIAALNENAKEENKYYKYDFTRDNCTTRLRDIVAKYSSQPFRTIAIVQGETTSRKLIHEYLDKSGQYWSGLGIDILLGARLDQKLSNRDIMFLPEYLLKGFDSSSTAGKNLVTEKRLLLQSSIPPQTPSFLSPLVIFSILFLLITVLSFSRNPVLVNALNIFDKIFFFVCGILGWMILFMWFVTEHYTTRNNFNILWALPTHLIVLPLSFKKSWIKTYFKIVFWISLLLLLTWFFLPQQMNNALFPVVGIIFVRSFFISKRV